MKNKWYEELIPYLNVLKKNTDEQISEIGEFLEQELEDISEDVELAEDMQNNALGMCAAFMMDIKQIEAVIFKLFDAGCNPDNILKRVDELIEADKLISLARRIGREDEEREKRNK